MLVSSILRKVFTVDKILAESSVMMTSLSEEEDFTLYHQIEGNNWRKIDRKMLGSGFFGSQRENGFCFI